MADSQLQAKKRQAQTLLQQNRVAEARELFGWICRRDSTDYQAWINYGALSGQLGQYAEAEQAFKQALALRPDDPILNFNLAGLAELQQNLAAAEHYYLNVLKLQPDSRDGLKRLTKLYLTLGRVAEAEAYCHRALALNSTDHYLHNCLANAKQEQGEYDAAEKAYQTALQYGANEAEIYCNLGNLFHAKGDFDAALKWYQKSLALAPRAAIALGNLGYLYFEHGHLEEARDCFDRALAIEPQNHGVRWNRALLLLLIGDFKQGWQDYEARFKTVETVRQFGRRHSDKPRWQGEDIGTQTLLVYAEQGLGDSLQFCRYLPLIKARVGNLVFECQPPVEALMQSLEHVDRVVTPGQQVEHDYQVPLLSLPGIMNTDFHTLPAAVPYLRADEAHLAKWQGIIKGDGLKVGLVWAGNPNGLNDKQRSMALRQLAPLGGVKNVTFYSLQKGTAAEQLHSPPPGLEIIDLAPQLHDFSDTAAAVCQLDLVISVCTAVAHLSGALGRPTWTLLCSNADWRWFLGREDSPWYPSMRLFRQSEPGTWAPVVERVASALAAQSADG